MVTDERVLWAGRPAMFRNSPGAFTLAVLLVPLGIGLVILLIWWLKCLATSWTVTPHRTVSRHGLLSKSTTELRHTDVRAIHVQQSFFQRLMGTGTIRLSSASSDDYEIEMSGVAKPEEVADLLRGLQQGQNMPERPIGSPPAPIVATLVSSPTPTFQMHQSVPPTAVPVPAIIVSEGLDGGLHTIANGLAHLGTQAGPWTFATAKRGWAHLRMAPGKIDPLLRSAAGEGNDVIYRFFQVAVVVLLAAAASGMLALLWLASWIWCSVPCLAVLFGIALLLVGGKVVERNRAAGGGIAGAGLVMLLLGLPLTALHISSSLGKQRQENEIRQANEQVASLVKIAQDDFDKGDLDKAENELQQVAHVAKATDTQAVGVLQGKIQTARQEAAIGKVNREVQEYVRLAGRDFSFDRLEAAEAKLTAALAIQSATDTANAKELLAKIPARRQELVNEKVTRLMADATEFFKAGVFGKAMQSINEAIAVKNATNTGEAEKLLDKMGDARPELLARDAIQAIQQRRYSIAVKRLKAYLANPRSDKKPVATQVLKLVEILLDDDKAQASLKAMSDGQIKSLSEDGKLPDDLATANAVLTAAVKAALVRNIPQERNRREAEERARVAEKAKREEEKAERERAQAELQRKALERYNNAQDEARARVEAARKAKEEYDENGLVLLWKTVKWTRGQFGVTVTGTVVNRRGHALHYAQITFRLFDDSGAQVGTAIANINGLESGDRWNFKATGGFGDNAAGCKLGELSGF